MKTGAPSASFKDSVENLRCGRGIATESAPRPAGLLEVHLGWAGGCGLRDEVEEAVRRAGEARLARRGGSSGADDDVATMEGRSRRVGRDRHGDAVLGVVAREQLRGLAHAENPA